MACRHGSDVPRSRGQGGVKESENLDSLTCFTSSARAAHEATRGPHAGCGTFRCCPGRAAGTCSASAQMHAVVGSLEQYLSHRAVAAAIMDHDMRRASGCGTLGPGPCAATHPRRHPVLARHPVPAASVCGREPTHPPARPPQAAAQQTPPPPAAWDSRSRRERRQDTSMPGRERWATSQQHKQLGNQVVPLTPTRAAVTDAKPLGGCITTRPAAPTCGFVAGGGVLLGVLLLRTSAGRRRAWLGNVDAGRAELVEQGPEQRLAAGRWSEAANGAVRAAHADADVRHSCDMAACCNV